MNSGRQHPQNISGQNGNILSSHLRPPSNWLRADVPGYVTLGSRPQFRRKLDSFLARRKDHVFRNLDPTEVPRLESSEEEILGAQSYAVCPTLDLFLELDIGERIREVFRNVKAGDLVLAKVQSHVPDGMSLKLLCFDGPKRAFLEDLDLIVSCYAEDMAMKDPSDPCLQYERDDTIRCEVVKICQRTRCLAIGMRGSKVSSEIQKLFPLGWVQDSELPRQYLYSADRVKFKKETTYEENLAKRTAFNNPSVSGLASMLGVNRNTNSFFIGLRRPFPVHSMLPSLIQVQNKKIVQKKLDKALDNCRQCKFDQALDDLSAVLVLDAENVEALIERGKIYSDRNLCEKAKRDIQAAAKLLPDDLEQRKQLADNLLNIGVKFQKTNRMESSLSCYEDCISVLSGLPGALSKLIHLNEEMKEFPSDLPGILVAKISAMKDELKRIIADEILKEEPAKEEESMKSEDVTEVAVSTLLEDGEVLSSPAASGLDEISSCSESKASDAAPEELPLLGEEHTSKEIDTNDHSSERSPSRKSPSMSSSSALGINYFDEDEKSTTDYRSPVDYSVTIRQGNSRRSVVEHTAYIRREPAERSRSSRRDRHGHRKSSRSTRSDRGHSGPRDRSREKRRRRTNSTGSSSYSAQHRALSCEKRRVRTNSSGSSDYSAQQRARKRTERSETGRRRRSTSCEKRRERTNSSSSSNYSTQDRARKRAGSLVKERRRRSTNCEKRRERMNSSSSSNYSAQHRARKRAASSEKGRRRRSTSNEKKRERMNSCSSSNYSTQQISRKRAGSAEKGRRSRSTSCEKRRERVNSYSSSNYSTQHIGRKRAGSAENGRRSRSRSCEKGSRRKQSNQSRSKSRSSREVYCKKNSARAASLSPSNSGARNFKSTEEVVNDVEAYLQKLEKAAIAKVFSEQASTKKPLGSNRVAKAAHDSPINKHDSALPVTNERSTSSSTTHRINFALKKSKIKITPDMVSVVFSSSNESSGSEDDRFTMHRAGNPSSKPLPEVEEILQSARYSPSRPLESSPDSSPSSTHRVPKETPSYDTSESSDLPTVKPLPDLPGSSENSPKDSCSSHVYMNEQQQEARDVSCTRNSFDAGPMRGHSSRFRSSRSHISKRRHYNDGAERNLSPSRHRSESRSRKSTSPNAYRVYEKQKIPGKCIRSSTSPGPRLRSTRRGSTSSESSVDQNQRTRYRSQSRSPVRSVSRQRFDTGRVSPALQVNHPPGLLPTDARFNPNYVSRNYRGKHPIPAGRFQRT